MKLILAVPITLVMVYRAWSRATLTHAGIVAAILTAGAHAIHPWNLPFGLLITFFLAGTRVTKIKHDLKSKLTIQASGDVGKESSRTHVQVFANSGVASVLSILHTYVLKQRGENMCHPWPGSLLFIGIVANYAAVAADTFSSELGILSKSRPRLITSLRLRKVPPGTNGGVTSMGLAAAFLGSFIIVLTSILLTPFCQFSRPVNMKDSYRAWTFADKLWFLILMTLWGALGSLLDSFLGGWLQQSVVDVRYGKIIEGSGGKRVLLENLRNKVSTDTLQEDLSHKGEVGKQNSKLLEDSDSLSPTFNNKPRAKTDVKENINERIQSVGSKALKMNPDIAVESGSLALLDNNEVNFVMALTMSVGAMVIACLTLQVPMST
ncbi:putative integral membrane protein duf92 [Erysiphe necator]|uniref:Putative integral membrane protein duf92 n=1 Tax=Uncinula necator TaxID=52586 RepID=A0A0B1P6P9_UNCNE|nr:putative integral membrane protein duf92 [Erysiphe necator]